MSCLLVDVWLSVSGGVVGGRVMCYSGRLFCMVWVKNVCDCLCRLC